MTPTELQQFLRDKLRKAYNFGQTYWQQADSEYRRENKKAGETAAKFAELVENVVLAVKFEMDRAATKAAKATGTAGELPPLIGMEVSMDVSTGDEDFDHRIFGRIEGLMDKGDGTDIILAVEESRNFATDTQAARQPAPVAAQENGGLVRAALIDLMEIEQAATAGEFKQDMTFDFAKQSHYRALFARARAALAATAAPVMQPEMKKIGWMWKKWGWTVTAHSKHREIHRVMDFNQPPESTKLSPDFISLEPIYIAATNRSQP